ncbi:hypothetical protein TWF281_006346 [Arthrobotrys megalospora]
MPKGVLMCAQCRKDKKSCLPKIRKWPTRCNRCIKYNYKCSPSASAKEDHSSHAEDQVEHKKLRPTRELIEELDYIKYLGHGLAKFVPVDPSLQTGWDILPAQAKCLASHAINSISVQIIEEAEAARDSLTMRGKSTDAEAIEFMLCRLIDDAEVIYQQPSRPLIAGYDESGKLTIRKLCLELQAGRIFTVLKTLQSWCEFDRTTWVDFVTSPSLNCDNKLLQIFAMALSVEGRFLARCESVDFTSALPIGSVSILNQELVDEFGNIENIIRWVDPLHIRALRSLSTKQAYRYMHTYILRCPETIFDHTEKECFELLDNTSERHWIRDASAERTPIRVSHAPERLTPLIRDIFLELSTRFHKPGRLDIKGVKNKIPVRPPDPETDAPVSVSPTIHVIPSAGNIWAPGPNPLLPGVAVMKVLPQVKFDSLSLAVIQGRLHDFVSTIKRQRVLDQHPSRVQPLFAISDRPFIVFAGPHCRIHNLDPRFSVFHAAIWNNQPPPLISELFNYGPIEYLTPSNMVDLYAIGIMHGNDRQILCLEAASKNQLKFPASQQLSDAREEITSLAIDFAPWKALRAMLKGPWFQHLNFGKDIARRLIFRADYWQTRLLSQMVTDDATLMYECYRQGYEAYCCAINLFQENNATDLLGRTSLQNRYNGLENCIAGACRQAGKYGSLRASVLKAPHRLYNAFESEYQAQDLVARGQVEDGKQNPREIVQSS